MSSTFILSSNYLGVSNSTPKPPLLLLVFLSSLFLQTAYSPSTIHNHTTLEKREKSLKALPKPAQRQISHSFPRRDGIHLSDFWTAAFLIIPQHSSTSKQQNKLIRKAKCSTSFIASLVGFSFTPVKILDIKSWVIWSTYKSPCKPSNVQHRNKRGWKISWGCPLLVTANCLCELHLDTTTVYLSRKKKI